MNTKQLINDTAKDIVARVDQRTTGDGWAKIRNYAGIASAVGFLLISPVCPIAIPAAAASWITFGSSLLAIIAGRAALDNSKKR